MQLARVDGTLLATACHSSLRGFRSVILQPLDEHHRALGEPVVALDPLGAALHQHVLYSTDGSRTRELVRDEHSPLRNHVAVLLDR